MIVAIPTCNHAIFLFIESTKRQGNNMIDGRLPFISVRSGACNATVVTYEHSSAEPHSLSPQPERPAIGPPGTIPSRPHLSSLTPVPGVTQERGDVVSPSRTANFRARNYLAPVPNSHGSSRAATVTGLPCLVGLAVMGNAYRASALLTPVSHFPQRWR